MQIENGRNRCIFSGFGVIVSSGARLFLPFVATQICVCVRLSSSPQKGDRFLVVFFSLLLCSKCAETPQKMIYLCRSQETVSRRHNLSLENVLRISLTTSRIWRISYGAWLKRLHLPHRKVIAPNKLCWVQQKYRENRVTNTSYSRFN